MKKIVSLFAVSLLALASCKQKIEPVAVEEEFEELALDSSSMRVDTIDGQVVKTYETDSVTTIIFE